MSENVLYLFGRATNYSLHYSGRLAPIKVEQIARNKSSPVKSPLYYYPFIVTDGCTDTP